MAQSPSVSKKLSKSDTEFDFFDALKWVFLEGEKITKTEWGNPEFYGTVINGMLVLHKNDGIYYPWLISEADAQGQDWTLIPRDQDKVQ